MILGPNWYLPVSGIPGMLIAIPAETAIALAFFWLAMWVLSTAGIVWEAVHDSPQRPIGKSKRRPIGRPPRGGKRRPALYPA